MSTETGPRIDWPARAGHRWSEQLYSEHHGRPLPDGPAPVLLRDPPLGKFGYTPATCPTGFNVRLLPVGGGVFVCPLCGLLSQWATR
jgi:hypothetical protein